MTGNIITKVFDGQEIEKICPIPSDAIETNSSTVLEGENVRTHQTFIQMKDGFEYSWDVEKLNGKFVSINMTHMHIELPVVQSGDDFLDNDLSILPHAS